MGKVNSKHPVSKICVVAGVLIGLGIAYKVLRTTDKPKKSDFHEAESPAKEKPKPFEP